MFGKLVDEDSLQVLSLLESQPVAKKGDAPAEEIKILGIVMSVNVCLTMKDRYSSDSASQRARPVPSVSGQAERKDLSSRPVGRSPSVAGSEAGGKRCGPDDVARDESGGQRQEKVGGGGRWGRQVLGKQEAGNVGSDHRK